MAEVLVPAAGVQLPADVAAPAAGGGVVVFAHGSGSSRHSPRNRMVAERLQAAGLGTVLVDLLTAAEEATDERTGELRFDLPLLAGRLTAVVEWAAGREWLVGSQRSGVGRIGLFGASTGAGAALITAADRPDLVATVVSRGGRPDLAGPALARVRCPVLLLVGERDPQVLRLNRAAGEQLAGEHALEVVPGATHLFGEPGALERVAEAAVAWFAARLGTNRDVPGEPATDPD